MTESALDITLTETAIAHFKYLIEKEAMPGLGLRLFLDHLSPKANVSITFLPPGEHRAGDIPMDFDGFTLWVEGASSPDLKGAQIDYKTDNMGGELAITAPNLKGGKPKEDASLFEKIEYVLQSEINPSLSSHGGVVSLVEITDKVEVVLRFGGGCHGCGMVDVTLKEGIEKALIAQFPEIAAVVDVTDHSTGKTPYYTHSCSE
jgi:Fe/S biogenesis protein NfuA